MQRAFHTLCLSSRWSVAQIFNTPLLDPGRVWGIRGHKIWASSIYIDLSWLRAAFNFPTIRCTWRLICCFINLLHWYETLLHFLSAFSLFLTSPSVVHIFSWFSVHISYKSTKEKSLSVMLKHVLVCSYLLIHIVIHKGEWWATHTSSTMRLINQWGCDPIINKDAIQKSTNHNAF